MRITSLAKLFTGAAVAFAIGTGAALAGPTTTLSVGIIGEESYSVNTGNITGATSTKTIPVDELVNETSTPTAAAAAGITFAPPITQQTFATFSTLTLNTTNGPDAFSVTIADLILSMTSVSGSQIVATGAHSQGSISEQFNGTVTGDTSAGQIFLGQTVSISETCTQTGLGASITCSESVITPGLPVTTPEPISIALLGVGVMGLGMVRRNRRN